MNEQFKYELTTVNPVSEEPIMTVEYTEVQMEDYFANLYMSMEWEAIPEWAKDMKSAFRFIIAVKQQATRHGIQTFWVGDLAPCAHFPDGASLFVRGIHIDPGAYQMFLLEDAITHKLVDKIDDMAINGKTSAVRNRARSQIRYLTGGVNPSDGMGGPNYGVWVHRPQVLYRPTNRVSEVLQYNPVSKIVIFRDRGSTTIKWGKVYQVSVPGDNSDPDDPNNWEAFTLYGQAHS